MKLLALILSLYSMFSFATTWSYQSYEMKPSPRALATDLDLKFLEAGFVSLVDPGHGVPSLGLNQVYFKNEGQFVLVKYSLEGNFPLDELIPTPSGILVHQQIENQKMMLYFRGFTQDYVKLMLNRLKQKVTSNSSFKPQIIPEAQADACGAFGGSVLAQESELNGISASAAWESLKSCMAGLGEGAYGSSVGLLEGLGKEALSLIKHPIDYAEKVANKVELFLVKAAKFMKGLITDPVATFNDMGKGLGKTWDTVRNTVATMSSEMKINFVCSFIGALGVDAALAFFTGGAASSKIVLTIGNLARKFTQTSKVLALLSKLSSGALARMSLQGDKLEKFMKGMFHNRFPEADLQRLNDLAHVGDELSLRTLSCYIR